MITVVFGKPRVGKTAYMVADIVKYLNRSAEGLDLYHRCCEEIEVINADGFRFVKPLHCPVYTNFVVNVQTGYNGFEGSYYIDGFRLGFENDNVEVLPVLPCSRIYLSEAQRYYNSRNSGVKALPDWVSRFYEEHGHFDLTIWLDMQRPGLLDLNIRELVTEFIFIEKMENKFDLMGNIVASRWKYKVFDDWKYTERFIDTGDGKEGKDGEKVFDGNVFDFYRSKCYRSQFIPKGDFAEIQHIYGVNSVEELEFAKYMYTQTPPEGFYPDIKRRK